MKIAVQGLGRMGMQIAKKLVEGGHEVIALDINEDNITEAVKNGTRSAHTKEEAIELFGQDKTIVWMMLPEELVDYQVNEWLALMAKQSIIIDGGNSDFRNTQKLNEKVKNSNINLIDVGVSGGVWGYKNGFPLMCGSDSSEAFETIKPILDSLIKPDGAYYLFGPSGAGHYVKMVHNAIEYGMMESLGEGFHMLHDGPYKINLAQAADLWQHHSVITSWLNDLSYQALLENPELDGVSGYVAESGEARWALEIADKAGFKLPSIQAAFDVRIASQKGETNFATKVVAAQRNKFGNHNLNGEGSAK
jgi:6-phosphogluconate dehydrogenase